MQYISDIMPRAAFFGALLLLVNRNTACAQPTIMDSAVNPVNGHTYYLLSNSDWTNAELASIALGGHLATVRNLSENTWIWNRWGTNNLWIGLHDPSSGDGSGAQHAADFVWTSGETNAYRNWAAGEPDNSFGQEYVVDIIPSNATGGASFWNDVQDALYGPPGVHGVAEVNTSTISLTNGLVAYYPFNGNANDASGNGYNGTVNGATLTTDRFNNPDTAYYFNGSNSSIDLTPLAFNNLTQGTIGTWIELDSTMQETIFAKQHPGANSYGIFTVGYYVASNGGPIPGQPGELYYHAANNEGNASSSTLLSAGVWHHVAVVFSSTNCDLYIDGNPSGSFSGNFSVPNDTSAITSIGDWGADVGIGMVGRIDDFRIYNRALSSSEVSQLYALEAGGLLLTNEPATVTNNVGDNVIMTVGATGSPMDFQWYFSGTNIDNGSNSTLRIASITQPYFGNYYVIVTNAFGSIVSSIGTIYEPATILSQPTNVIVPLQSPARFSVLATGYPAPSFYQWIFNGTNIAGANSNSLTIPSVKLSDTGNYQVLVSNAIGATNSLIAALDIPPTITAPFVGATPIWGRAATLSVGAIGNGTLAYQWYFNGQPISGAVYPQLDFSSIQLTNSGFYSVVISSPYGSVTNAAYEVAVDPAVISLGFYPGLTINGAMGNSYLIQRSANLSSPTNWQTVSSLTLYQPVELWIDTSVDASSPFNNMYFYQVIPQ